MSENPQIPDKLSADAESTPVTPAPVVSTRPLYNESRPRWSFDLTPAFILIAVGLAMGTIFYDSKTAYCPNDASRWDTIYALVTRGEYTFSVDDAPQWRWMEKDRVTTSQPHHIPPIPTCDMVKLGDDFLSSKPPLLPTILAGLVEVEQVVCSQVSQWAGQFSGRQFADKVTYDTHPMVITRTTLILVQVLPLAVALLLIRHHVFRLAESDWARNFTMAAVSLGTYLTPWVITLNNHVIAAFLGMIALHCALLIWYEDRRQWYLFSLAGFFGFLTAAFELPGLALAVAVFGAMLLKDAKRTLIFALPCALIPIAAALYTNYLAFGDIRPIYARKNEPNGPYHYEGSYWNNPGGIDALNEPRWLYLVHMLVGHHGWFLLTPLWLISLLGMLIHFFKRGATSRAGLALFVLALFTVVVAFYDTRPPGDRSYGGTCQGFRWMFWMIPMWMIFLAAGVQALSRVAIGRFICYLCLLMSVISVASVYRQPWSKSWAHSLFSYLDVINY